VKLHSDNQKYLYSKLNGYGGYGKISFKGACYTFIDYQIHIKVRRNL
jgi:hypothetical protein